MRYLPKSQSERQEMLAAIGANSIEQLFESIPTKYRLREPLKLPGPLSEMEIIDYFRARAAENSRGYTSLLGAGVYSHVRSVVTDALVQRGEFLTSYTPYQAEISQGTLQAIFEFQTLMCQLAGQEVANASMYDGSTALTEAVLMAERLTGRHRVLIARTVHPEYRQVLATYAKHLGIEIDEIGFTPGGQLNLSALREEVLKQTAAVVVQSPNFFGVLEQLGPIAEAAHAHGALLIDSVTEAVALGAIRPPEEADIVSIEAQSFGVPPSYGGPFVGGIATREKFVRQMPGRLAGEAFDANGRRGYVLTLATREQHIRREKATSNICTNEALYALVVTIHLCLLGKEGLRELASQNLAKAEFAKDALKRIPGVSLPFSGKTFNEFVVEFPKPMRQINEKLLGEKIIGPLPLDVYYRGDANRGLLCVTELTPRAEIERFVAALRGILTATN
ncbi:MAG TPA: aminomethyl-transferring glycine dehydrogenase subunit GcvPA [Candidatus Acidoferrales bacterium]|nr:aminomethyl-transferring glycine dehydrogenase subunit GcvPA [Candidatus Acidoferrales bacterium]